MTLIYSCDGALSGSAAEVPANSRCGERCYQCSSARRNLERQALVTATLVVTMIRDRGIQDLRTDDSIVADALERKVFTAGLERLFDLRGDRLDSERK